MSLSLSYLQRSDRRFTILYLVTALGFIVSSFWLPYHFSFVIKALPIFVLFYWVNMRLKGHSQLFMVLALFFCLGGDIALDLNTESSFAIGLFLFLTGHVFYMIFYFLNARRTFNGFLRMFILLLYTGIMAFLILPKTGDMMLPVAIYLVIITLMGISAGFFYGVTTSVFTGAIIFIISDSIIAVDRFLVDIPQQTVYVMITYYLGQLLMVAGVLSRFSKR